MQEYRLYYETLRRRNYWRNFFRNSKAMLLETLRKGFGTDDIFLTRAGRTGIVLALRAFGLSRGSEVLVPEFMSTCVLDAVNQVALPSLRLSDNTKAVLFYHHWGYQQDFSKAVPIILARNLLVIEDCAHGLWGKSQGKLTGEFGHVAILSLSKIFEMTYAGAIRVNDPSLREKIRESLMRPSSLKDLYESLIGELIYVKFYNSTPDRRKGLDLAASLAKWYATLLTYPNLTTVRGNLPYDKEQLDNVFATQNRHFLKILKASRNTSFMLPDDDINSMAPLCFPILSDDEGFRQEVIQWMFRRKIIAATYSFDVNRNMFETCYKKCVPIPLYASMPDSFYEEFILEFQGRF